MSMGATALLIAASAAAAAVAAASGSILSRPARRGAHACRGCIASAAPAGTLARLLQTRSSQPASRRLPSALSALRRLVRRLRTGCQTVRTLESRAVTRWRPRRPSAISSASACSRSHGCPSRGGSGRRANPICGRTPFRDPGSVGWDTAVLSLCWSARGATRGVARARTRRSLSPRSVWSCSHPVPVIPAAAETMAGCGGVRRPILGRCPTSRCRTHFLHRPMICTTPGT
mmetsp:Transcript_28801/g.65235  ORF Transcript_28801/g.65235 Transcript_28801/m.65235 type:complete len:231 (-) Transcript_28801:1275-1967(-)